MEDMAEGEKEELNKTWTGFLIMHVKSGTWLCIRPTRNFRESILYLKSWSSISGASEAVITWNPKLQESVQLFKQIGLRLEEFMNIFGGVEEFCTVPCEIEGNEIFI